MNGIWHLSTILMALLCVTAPAAANEANFLKSLQGQWTGGGPVRIRVNWSPITVSCNFDTQADNNTLTMKGTCRGLMFMSRSISADIRYRDAGYSGWYIGPKGGRARVNGSNAQDFILDTGSEETIISADTARRHRVRAVTNTLSAGVGEIGVRGLQLARIQSLDLGTPYRSF